MQSSNSNHFMFGCFLTSFILCLIFSFFTFYFIFDLFLGWVSNPPAFIYRFQLWLVSEYSYSEGSAGFVMVLGSLITAATFGFIAFFTSKKIEREEGLIVDTPKEDDQGAKLKESISFSGLLFIIILGVLFVVLFLQRSLFGF